MEAIKPNDVIYTKFGYGVVVELAPPKVDTAELEELVLYRGESKLENEETQQTIDDDQIVEIQFRWGGKGYLQAKDLKKRIKIKVKPFIGDRKIQELELSIKATISTIYSELNKKMGDALKTVSNPKFYYPMGCIQHLDSSMKTLMDYQIPDGAQILMMVKNSFQWSSDRKPDNLELSNNNLTVRVSRNSDGGRSGNCTTIVGNTKMSSGKHYWTIKLDHLNHNDESISIGICYDGLDRCQKFSPENTEEYGRSAGKGDSIGICLEFKNMYGTLSYYKNGHFMGIAERNLVGPFYAAVTFFAPDSQITLDHSPRPS